jgi:hypothetical protein
MVCMDAAMLCKWCTGFVSPPEKSHCRDKHILTPAPMPGVSR